MLPRSETRPHVSPRTGLVRVSACIAAVTVTCLAACASAPPPAAGLAPRKSRVTANRRPRITLGPWPKSGCFNVELAGSDRYRFLLDDVEYPNALGAGQVEVSVRAPQIGELAPRVLTLPRLPRLEFAAQGRASGAFEIKLTLVDGEGHHSETTRLERICDR